MELKPLYLAGSLFIVSTALSGTAQANAIFDVNVVTDNAMLLLQVGDQMYAPEKEGLFSQVIDEKGKTIYALPEPITTRSLDGSSELTVDYAEFDPEPFLSFSVTAVNNSNTTQTYLFSFTTPLFPALNGLVNSVAHLDATLFDTLNNGATVQPLSGHKMLESYDLFGNGDNISKNVDIGSMFHINSGTQATAFNLSGALNCVPSCTNMESILSFTLSPHDKVNLVARIEQAQANSAVPTPNTLLLLIMSAFVGMSSYYGKRKKSDWSCR